MKVQCQGKLKTHCETPFSMSKFGVKKVKVLNFVVC